MNKKDEVTIEVYRGFEITEKLYRLGIGGKVWHLSIKNIETGEHVQNILEDSFLIARTRANELIDSLLKN